MKDVRAKYDSEFLTKITNEFLAIQPEEIDQFRLRSKIEEVRETDIYPVVLEMKYARLLLGYEDAVSAVKKLSTLAESDREVNSLGDEVINCLELILEFDKNAKTISTRKGGIAKSQNSPKRREIDFVYECWLAWEAKPDQYKNKTKFAKAMLDKCPHLESEKYITDLCRDWKKREKL